MPKPEAKPDDLLACGDAAKILECSADNVRRRTSSGHLAVAFTAANPYRPIALDRRAHVGALRAKRARPQRTPIPTERRSRRAVRS